MHPRNWRRRALAGLAAAVGATALAASFEWTGQRGSTWTTCDNWTYTGLPPACYPSVNSDDVTIPYESGGWTINVISIDHLDDMTIYGDVTFGPVSGSPTLKCESLTISTGIAAEAVEITISGATIHVEDY
ncbi:hypothetical protein RAS1_38310 [Phycisphaerae bacterium RAS1]|nr:hypothetical protein RAS1_38310 [Phycisphaerae bacterium RAS1]